MRQQIHLHNPPPPPIESAARDLLASVDHFIRQHELRGGEIAPDQMVALLTSREAVRRELRRKAGAVT